MAAAHQLGVDDLAELRILLADVSVVLDAREADPSVRLSVPAVDRAATATTDGRPADEVLAEQRAADGGGQHRSYLVLSAEERARGYVRPVRMSYVHVVPKVLGTLRPLTPEELARHAAYGYVRFEEYTPEMRAERGGTVVGRFYTQAELDRVQRGCGARTTMGRAIAETYARDPSFYGSTFCSGCGAHHPVGPPPRGEFVWDDGSYVGT
jgi:hypothetical protein